MHIENLALSTASRPSVGPTCVSKVLLAAAPAARRSAARRPGPWPPAAAANGSPKPPSVMRPRPPPMRPSITGAELILSSRMMAILRPMLSPVSLLEEVGALAVERRARPRGGRSADPRSDLGVREVLAGELGAACAGSRCASSLSGVASPVLVVRLRLLVADLVVGRHRVVAGERRRRTSPARPCPWRAGRRPRAAGRSPSRSSRRGRPRCRGTRPSWRRRGRRPSSCTPSRRRPS